MRIVVTLRWNGSLFYVQLRLQLINPGTDLAVIMGSHFGHNPVITLFEFIQHWPVICQPVRDKQPAINPGTGCIKNHPGKPGRRPPTTVIEFTGDVTFQSLSADIFQQMGIVLART